MKMEFCAVFTELLPEVCYISAGMCFGGELKMCGVCPPFGGGGDSDWCAGPFHVATSVELKRKRIISFSYVSLDIYCYLAP